MKEITLKTIFCVQFSVAALAATENSEQFPLWVNRIHKSQLEFKHVVLKLNPIKA